jgi:hypothetical protein
LVMQMDQSSTTGAKNITTLLQDLQLFKISIVEITGKEKVKNP